MNTLYIYVFYDAEQIVYSLDEPTQADLDSTSDILLDIIRIIPNKTPQTFHPLDKVWNDTPKAITTVINREKCHHYDDTQRIHY